MLSATHVRKEYSSVKLLYSCCSADMVSAVMNYECNRDADEVAFLAKIAAGHKLKHTAANLAEVKCLKSNAGDTAVILPIR